MSLFSSVVLEGRFVRLEPLRPAHLDALWEAASESRATFGLTSVPRTKEELSAYVDFACAEQEGGRALPFATIDRARGRVVGSTRFARPELWDWPDGAPEPLPDGPDAVEIGWTWLAPSAQRTPINTEAKLLMLAHAFERCRLRRVALKTDSRNVRSRAAMERLGLRFDGVLRAHLPASDEGIRDSAYYSVIASEWPRMRAHLERRLAGGQGHALEIARATASDAEVLASLVVSAEPQGVRPGRIREALETDAWVAWIGRAGADFVGFCALEPDRSPLAGDGEARIWLRVREEFPERSVVRALVAAAVEHARRNGWARLRVDAASPERSAFTELGFREVLSSMELALGGQR